MRRYQVKVIPRSSSNQVHEMKPGALKVKLTAPPVEGKANELLIKVLAEHFDVRRSQVRIAAGASARHKIVEIS